MIIVSSVFRGEFLEQFRGKSFFSLSSPSKKDKGWFEHGNHAELSLAEIQEANSFAFRLTPSRLERPGGFRLQARDSIRRWPRDSAELPTS